MIHTLTIRSATAADVASVAALFGGLSQEDSRQRDPLVDQAVARAEATDHFASMVTGDRSVCLLAVVTDTPIGYLAGYLAAPSTYRPVSLARLESIFVDPAWRGQHVGARLTAAFVSWAHTRGAARIAVTAYATNQRAITFYERLGFTPYVVTLEAPIPLIEAPTPAAKRA